MVPDLNDHQLQVKPPPPYVLAPQDCEHDMVRQSLVAMHGAVHAVLHFATAHT